MEVRGDIFIPPEAYPYLVAQRGAISDFRENQMQWLDLYANQLGEEYRNMKRYLPESCDSILDVGAGCGGIDVLLSHHFSDECSVTLLDGMNDPPFVSKHSNTFANFEISKRLLHANGVSQVFGINADCPPASAPRYWDLVISQKSWCFHYEPDRYLRVVKSGCLSGQTRLILDVRNDKPHWLVQLRAIFKHLAIIKVGPKHTTHAFEEPEKRV
jgi:hypothetical protein